MLKNTELMMLMVVIVVEGCVHEDVLEEHEWVDLVVRGRSVDVVH